MIRVALSTTSKKSYNSRPNEPSGLAFFHTRNSHRLLLQYDTALSIYKDTVIPRENYPVMRSAKHTIYPSAIFRTAFRPITYPDH